MSKAGYSMDRNIRVTACLENLEMSWSLASFMETSRHVASLRVLLTKLRRVTEHATPIDAAAVGGALHAKRSDIPILIDRYRGFDQKSENCLRENPVREKS